MSKVGRICFDIVVGAGALACVLAWLEVKPKDVRMMAWPHWLWLIGALILSAISLGSSLYVNTVAAKRFESKIASINQANAEEIVRINKQHESDEYRIRQARDQIAAELRAANEKYLALTAAQSRESAAQPKPSQYPVPQLRAKIIAMVSELQGFQGEHGDEPVVTRLMVGVLESKEDFIERFRTTVPPWRAKFIGDYRQRFGDSVPKLRDEIRVRAQTEDRELNEAIDAAANSAEGSCVAVKNIVKRLWDLAVGVNT